MRDFTERGAALEHLVDVMGLMVGHVLDLEVDVVVRKLRVTPLSMPVRWSELLKTTLQLLAVREEPSSNSFAASEVIRSNSVSPSGSYDSIAGLSSASIAATRPSKPCRTLQMWQTSSLRDHLP